MDFKLAVFGTAGTPSGYICIGGIFDVEIEENY
jgi:hypothetical protein